MLSISLASAEEYPEVRAFYHSLIDALEGCEYHPMWQKDIYPAPEELQEAIAADTLYIGRCDGRIAGAMVVNENYNEPYRTVSWPTDLQDGEFSVIHMLGVHSDFAGRGFAKDLVRFAIELAQAKGRKAIRLDVLKGNYPASRLYESMGFQYVDTVTMFYEDTGWMDFDLYEREQDTLSL